MIRASQRGETELREQGIASIHPPEFPFFEELGDIISMLYDHVPLSYQQVLMQDIKTCFGGLHTPSALRSLMR